VVALHGFGETPAVMARTTRFHVLGAREGFHVAYGKGRARRWDAFDDLDYRDVAYLRKVVDDAAARYAVDPRRVYLVGVSNGGMMVHRAAAEASGLFAAAAAVLAVMPARVAQRDRPGRPLPMLLINGLDDPLVRPDRDRVRRFFLVPLEVYPLDETAAWWAARNRCGGPGDRELLADRDPDDGTRAWRQRYRDCAAPVEVVGIEGGGHAWPGGALHGPAFLTGRISRDVDATALIWEFFRKHSLPARDSSGR
jgi:polyhydroxybutyrate depolymerase